METSHSGHTKHIDRKKSKIKVRAFPYNTANRALLHDEVRILTFNDPTEEKLSVRPRWVCSTDFGVGASSEAADVRCT